MAWILLFYAGVAITILSVRLIQEKNRADEAEAIGSDASYYQQELARQLAERDERISRFVNSFDAANDRDKKYREAAYALLDAFDSMDMAAAKLREMVGYP